MTDLRRRIKYAFYRRKGFVRVQMGGSPILLSTGPNTKQVLWLRRRLRRDNFEPHVIQALLENVREGQTCFEIGSWIGPYSILLSRLVGETGNLYLFEPDPVARMACTHNLSLNRCENAFLFPLALSDSNGGQLLYSDHFGNSVSSLVPGSAAESRALQSVRVLTCTLDSFVEATGSPPDLVKIDVEGAEDKVIEGGQRALSKKGVKIIMEVHGKFLRQRGVDPGSIIARLRSLNKRVWMLGASPKELTDDNSQGFTDLPRFHILASD